MLQVFALFAIAALIGPCTAWAQATVTGVVLDQSGTAVPNSRVEAFPVQGGGFVGNIAWAQVDDHGNFRMVLREGDYEIRAKDESGDYPDPNALLSVDPKAVFPRITISKQDISGVRVKLGSKGGILEGDLRDKVTHRPIPKAKITISDASRPKAFVEVFTDANGHFQFTVPSRALLVSVSARGYKISSFESGRPLTLSAGERRAVFLEIDPQ